MLPLDNKDNILDKYPNSLSLDNIHQFKDNNFVLNIYKKSVEIIKKNARLLDYELQQFTDKAKKVFKEIFA